MTLILSSRQQQDRSRSCNYLIRLTTFQMDSINNQFKFLLIFVYAIAGVSLFNVVTLINNQIFGIEFLLLFTIDTKYKIFLMISCFFGTLSYLGTAIGVQFLLRYGRIRCVHLDIITVLRSQEGTNFSWRMGRLIELLLLANASFCCSANLLLATIFFSAMNADWTGILLGCFHAVYAIIAVPLALYLFFGFIAEPIPEGCDYWFRQNRDRFMKCDIRYCMICSDSNGQTNVQPVPSISLQIEEQDQNERLPQAEESQATPSAPPAPPIVEEVGEESEDCSICFQDSADLTINPCGHRLCAACSSRVHNCPFCRSPIMSVR